MNDFFIGLLVLNFGIYWIWFRVLGVVGIVSDVFDFLYIIFLIENLF